MQFASDSEFAGELLAASERNEKISRHIQAARRSLISMAAAVMLLAVLLVAEARSIDYAIIAIVGFVLGYGVRSVKEVK